MKKRLLAVYLHLCNILENRIEDQEAKKGVRAGLTATCRRTFGDDRVVLYLGCVGSS